MPEETQQKPDLSTVAKARAEWVKALRSGEYQQGRGKLKLSASEPDYPAGFCCLGVAGDLCVKAEMGGARWGADDALRYEGGVAGGILSAEAAQVFGLGRDSQKVLWNANDVSRKTFAEIADMIEQAGTGDIR